MDGLTSADIDALLGKRRTKKPPQAIGRYLDSNNEWQPLLKSDMKRISAYDSKVGSTRRSRKGRTYKAPNGYARFPSWMPEEITSYILFPR